MKLAQMRRKISVLSVLLVCVMLVGILAACGQGTSSSSSSQASSSSAASSSATSDSTQEGPADLGAPGEIDHQTYPIVDEKITLSLWVDLAAFMGELADFNESEFYQWYEEKTNIHIEFIVPAANTGTDAFNLLFASDNMPDIVQPYTISMKYRGGEDKAIEDGYFVDMADYLEYAPNYQNWINHGEESGFAKAVYTDTGKMYGMWAAWESMYPELGVMPECGLAIRQDFLDLVGMDIPTTYDEWTAVLTAFRDKLGVYAPFYTSKYGIDQGEFMAGFGTAPYFYQVDGTVKYGPLDDEYKEYLEFMHNWYKEGLLDPDFATRASAGIAADNDVMLSDKVGALTDWATRLSETYVVRGAPNPDFYMVAAPQPTKKGGPDPHYHYETGPSQLTYACYLFSADGDHIEEAVRWVDGHYAGEVLQNANYGLTEQEGTVWFAAPDGHRIGDYDFRFSNPDGLSSTTVYVKYWTRIQPIRVEASQIEQADDNKQSAYKTWAIYDSDWKMPANITMTSDEGTKYATTYADIETYVQESNIKFITGSTSLDTYDAYRDTLRQMGIENAIALQQAALDRYNSR